MDAKTVQKRVRPITLRCSTDGCPEKAEGAETFVGDETEGEIVAPRGWVFGARDPRSTKDAVYGLCPKHSKR